jgi:hypothetical protein
VIDGVDAAAYDREREREIKREENFVAGENRENRAGVRGSMKFSG